MNTHDYNMPGDEQIQADEARWQAVLARDGRHNGRFVYAVSSTGIYCRPSCPSRHPRRERVRFFAGPDEAERAGFRACKRCTPRAALSPEVETVQCICRFIESEPDGPITLAALGAQAGLSPFHLQRLFKRVMGVTPRHYAATHRLGRFKGRVQDTEDVTGALYDAGYASSSGLYARAPLGLGMTPNTYARGGATMHIRYATSACSLGCVLVAATERGICTVTLGGTDVELEEALRREFPAAQIARDDLSLRAWTETLVRYVEGGQPLPDLPLDVMATAFQSRVWAALRAIPSGETRSYSQIAISIGRPTAARAVAQACAANPAALVIPCHRVVRENGHMGGYRWGIERKQQLLKQEASGEKAGVN